LGRAPLFFADNPYVYAGANPLSNVDPSGQRTAGASSSQVKEAAKKQAQKARVQTKRGTSVKYVVTLHSVKVAKMSLHMTAAPSLLDPQAGWDFAKAVVALAAGIVAMMLAGATFATIGAEGADPVGDLIAIVMFMIAIVMFMNGIDAFIHAAEFAAEAIWGGSSGIAMILKSFAVIADLVITLADAATIALLLTPATIGGVVAALGTNVAALTAIYTLTGVDLGADIMDLQDLLGK
jgi:hypothetical protein